MTKRYVGKTVNIEHCPTVEKNIDNVSEITIGDLHANAIKLMFLLQERGICQITPEKYDRLVQIYNMDARHLTKEILSEFDSIIANIEILNRDILIRLIGDELADRGSNDYFVLKILEKLRQEKVPYEIIISNHSIEFVENYELNRAFGSFRIGQGGQTASSYNLQSLIDSNLVTRKDIDSMVNKVYKPALRAISYSLDEINNGITIFSHAAIDVNAIQLLAEKLKVPFLDATTAELAQTIDAINRQFATIVAANEVHKLYDINTLGMHTDRQPTIESVFEFIMWNRNTDILKRPANYHGYQLSLVHGHDRTDQTFGHLYNLDNVLGKPGWHQAEYTILTTDEKHALLQLDLFDHSAPSTEEEPLVDNTPAPEELEDTKQQPEGSEQQQFEKTLQAMANRIERFKRSNYIDKDYRTEKLQAFYNEFKKAGEHYFKGPPTQARQEAFNDQVKALSDRLAKPKHTDTKQKDTWEKEFKDQLKLLADKRDSFQRRKETKAYEAARDLHDGLTKESDKYFSAMPTKGRHEMFQSACDGLIKTSRKELDKHRGCKQLLGNIALAVLMLGIVYLVAIMMNKAKTGNYLFFSKTASTKQVEEIQDVVEKIRPKH